MLSQRVLAPFTTTSLTVATVLFLCTSVGCKPKENDATSTTAESAAADAGDAKAGEADGDETPDTGDETTGGADATGSETGADTDAADTDAADTDAADTDAADTDAADTDAADTDAADTDGTDTDGDGDTDGAAEADPVKPLLDEVTNKRTKDDRAMEALAEAKAAGAEPNDLAAAANKRGERLITSPDRATKFFEWAREADPKYPNASFNLAKLAANTGDVAVVKDYLKETKERGGKKLLKTVGFDPTFALVADDPDVVALMK